MQFAPISFENSEYLRLGISEEFEILRITPAIPVIYESLLPEAEDGSVSNAGNSISAAGYNPLTEAKETDDKKEGEVTQEAKKPDEKKPGEKPVNPQKKKEDPLNPKNTAQGQKANVQPAKKPEAQVKQPAKPDPKSGSIPPSRLSSGSKDATPNKSAFAGGGLQEKTSFKTKLTNTKDAAKKKFSDFKNNPTTQKAIAAVKKTAVKVQDFTKSSVAKVNNMPIEQQEKAITQQMAEAREDPKTLGEHLKKGLKTAGKGVAILGLAMVNLPIAAAVVVTSKAISAKNKRAAAEELQHEVLKIDALIAKAEQEGDYDKKADLLIAKRTAIQAHAKLRYGLRHKVDRPVD